MEHLYMDVLYTIKYKVGNETELGSHREQLYMYARRAFDVTVEQHRRFMAIVHVEKVSFDFSATMQEVLCNTIILRALGNNTKCSRVNETFYC